MLDSQLLEGFVARRDPAAFGALVARHGPAVLRVCRRHLNDPHEAEDALQATFLILLRRAPSIRDPELLNRWLVGVARRVAVAARRRGVLRSDRERRWAEMHPEACEQGWPRLDLRRVVDEEMASLPEEFRRPLALCYLEGCTHEEAASRLGWPLGTVKVRLVRARRLLRGRLDRRGVSLGVALLLFLLGRDAAAAGGLSADLAAATVEALTLAEAGKSAALRARYPGAFEMARRCRFGGQTLRGWAPALLAVTFVFLATGGLAMAHRVRADRESAASARLAKVLETDCR